MNTLRNHCFFEVMAELVPRDSPHFTTTELDKHTLRDANCSSCAVYNILQLSLQHRDIILQIEIEKKSNQKNVVKYL